MEIKTKFNPNDTAYFFKIPDHIDLITISSIEIKATGKESKVTYISKDNKEFTESDLLTAREITAKINGY